MGGVKNAWKFFLGLTGSVYRKFATDQFSGLRDQRLNYVIERKCAGERDMANVKYIVKIYFLDQT